MSRKNYTFWSRPSQKPLHHPLHQNNLRQLTGAKKFTLVTPENSWGNSGPQEQRHTSEPQFSEPCDMLFFPRDIARIGISEANLRNP